MGVVIVGAGTRLGVAIQNPFSKRSFASAAYNPFRVAHSPVQFARNSAALAQIPYAMIARKRHRHSIGSMPGVSIHGHTGPQSRQLARIAQLSSLHSDAPLPISFQQRLQILHEEKAAAQVHSNSSDGLCTRRRDAVAPHWLSRQFSAGEVITWQGRLGHRAQYKPEKEVVRVEARGHRMSPGTPSV